MIPPSFPRPRPPTFVPGNWADGKTDRAVVLRLDAEGRLCYSPAIEKLLSSVRSFVKYGADFGRETRGMNAYIFERALAEVDAEAAAVGAPAESSNFEGGRNKELDSDVQAGGYGETRKPAAKRAPGAERPCEGPLAGQSGKDRSTCKK